MRLSICGIMSVTSLFFVVPASKFLPIIFPAGLSFFAWPMYVGISFGSRGLFSSDLYPVLL